ncbi:MAG: alpha/beta hydrolase, partial [Solirubrobacterales bacterium]
MERAHSRRRAQVRRRRRVALLGATGLIAVFAALSFVNSRGGIENPRQWAVNPHGTKRESVNFQSKAVGRRLTYDVILPRDYEKSQKRPMLVLLHGRGASATGLSPKALIKAVGEVGPKAPIVVLPYGGEASYFHNRADGRWADYIMKEVIPRAAGQFGGDRNRVAVGGMSMGGYGAFNLVRGNRGRFCALGGHSPALWQTGGESAAGAFDNAEDFAANDVIAAARNGSPAYEDIPIWIDAGDNDPFQPGIRAMGSALRAEGADLTAKTWPGDHTYEYWSSHFPSYLKFYTRALAS